MGCFTQPQAIKALTIYYEIISLLTYIIIDINIPVTCALLPLEDVLVRKSKSNSKLTSRPAIYAKNDYHLEFRPILSKP